MPASVFLMERGPNLGFPFSSQLKTSRFPEMRELRVQAGGDPLRMLCAFDPRRTAVLLVAGDKTSDDRWYETKEDREGAGHVFASISLTALCSRTCRVDSRADDISAIRRYN